MKKYKPSRNELFQYAYDLGLEGVCNFFQIDEDKFWDILYPPVPQIAFPTYAKKEVPFNPELSDLIAVDYLHLRRKAIGQVKDDISREDSLQDAIVIALQEFGHKENPDREEVRAFILKKFQEIEYFLKINRLKFNGDEM